MNFSEMHCLSQHYFSCHSYQLLLSDGPTIHIVGALMKRLAKRQTNDVVESETLTSVKSIIYLDLNDENIFIDANKTDLG